MLSELSMKDILQNPYAPTKECLNTDHSAILARPLAPGMSHQLVKVLTAAEKHPAVWGVLKETGAKVQMDCKLIKYQSK